MSFRALVAEQRKFFKSGQTATYEHRIQALQKLRQILNNGREQLIDAVYKDLRRERRTTDFVEITTCLQEIDYFCENLKEWMQPEYAERTLATMFDELYIVREPYGCALLLGPFNYPIFLVILPLIALIAAGNTVIMKPSDLTPHVAHVFDQLFTEVFDKKFISVVVTNTAGTIELTHERFDIIMFTGSTAVGREVMKAAAENLTPVVLEMGGKCPALIEEDADMYVTAKRIVWGKFLNCGQTCIAPDYLIMTQKTRKLLFSTLVQVIHEFYGNDPKQSPDYSRIVNERHFDRIFTLIQQTKGMILHKGGEPDRSDLYIPPMIIEVDEESDALMNSEIFGPLLPIYIVEDFDEAIEFLRHRESPINASIFTRNADKVDRLIKEVHAGNVLQNDVIMNFTVDTLPFSGVGQSGLGGAYRGKFGFDTFSHRKSVMKRGFFADCMMTARYPPMTDSKYKTLLMLTARRAMPRLLKMIFRYLPLILIGIILQWKFGSSSSSPNGHFLTRK